MRSKKFWALTISIVLILPVYKIVQACSDGPDPYDYFPSFFQNTVLQDHTYTPFYYTRYLDYYDHWYDYKADDALPDANIHEWQTFTGNTVPEADLDSFIYKYTYSALSTLYRHIDKDEPLSVSKEIADNRFTKWLIVHKDLEALGYLMYAKQCEPYAASAGDWQLPTADTAKMSRLTKSGLQLQKAAKQDFFKWRFTFQAMRMAFYNSRNKQTLDIYNTLIADKTDGGSIYARCLGLRAGALFRTGHKVEAAYFFSRVFDLSDEEKRSAFISYDWCKGFENATVLQLCKTAHERAVVHVMGGLKQYGKAIPEMEAAYAADPMVNGLDVLMTREIQKTEERYLQPKLLTSRGINSSSWYYNRYDVSGGNYSDEEPKTQNNKEAEYGAYLKQLAAFAQKAVVEGKAGHKAFWQLSCAYIALMQGNAADTKRFLDDAQQTTMTAREHDLHDIINTLYLVRRADKMTPEVESELLPSLKWLDAQAGNSKAFDKSYRDLMSTVLANAYLKNEDTVKAIYVLARAMRAEGGKFTADADFMDIPGSLLEHVSVSGLQAAQAFEAAGGKSVYEKWLLTNSPYTASMLRELEGTKYLREHQFSKAVGVLKNVAKADLDKRILPDPFLFRIPEVYYPDAEDSVHALTKLAFAQKMASLAQQIAASPNNAQALFDYGQGLYSMSYYGKASEAFAYYRSTSDENGYYETPARRLLPEYVRDYYGVFTAQQYFDKAIAAATEPELKAKAIWMAAKCWQKRCIPAKKDGEYDWDHNDYFVNALSNPYFRQLRAAGTQTLFYEQARSSCGYLRDYLSRNK